MATASSYLNAWREYENTCRDILGKSPLEREQMLEKQGDDPAIVEKLKLCRIQRNFLSHTNEVGFVNVSDAQMTFIANQTNEIKNIVDTAGKNLNKTCVFIDSARCDSALSSMCSAKIPYCVSVTSKGLKIISIYDCAKAAMTSKRTKLSDVKGISKPVIEIDENVNMDSLCPANVYVVLKKDGTPKGLVKFKSIG